MSDILFRTPRLGADELKVTKAVGKIYNSLKFALAAPSRWSGVLRRNMLAQAIRGSNSIEGYFVSKQDAIAAVDGDDPLEAQDETWREVIGYRNAMTYVLQLAKDPEFKINEGFLRSFHYMMLQHDLLKNPGNWRSGTIYVRDEQKNETVYEGPPAENVPGLIHMLLQYLRGTQDSDHLLVKGAMAHLNLVMIHPFSDGNGRMARCLQTLVLATGGAVEPTFSSIEEYLGRHTQNYYDVLLSTGRGSWNPQNDTRDWIRFNLIAHYRQAAVVLIRKRMIARLWDQLEKEIKNRRLNERMIFALSDAAMGYHVRSSHYRNVADVSPFVASRDLKALVDSGLLIPAGEKRSRIYDASEELRSMYLKIRTEEFRQIPDPFEVGAALILP